MAPYSVSNLKLAISSWLTPISLRQSSKSPTQSLKVPIFATLPGITPLHLWRRFGSAGVPPARLRAKARSRKSLLRLEHRRPLLHVSRQSFFGVLALEKQLLILAFHRQRRFHRNFPPSLHRTL